MAEIKIKKNDFVEIEFTGRTENAQGNIFDTTDLKEAKEAGLADDTMKDRFKPLRLCVGQGMILKAIDDALEGKELDKEFTLNLNEKDAYGKRDSKLVRTVPLTAFEQMPQRGMFVNVNGMVAKVISINSGRVMIDMNHPLSGKSLFYKMKITKIITDKLEKVKVLVEFYGIRAEDVSLENEKAVIKLKTPEIIQKQIKEKIKSILSIETEFKEGKKEKLEDTLKK